MTWFNAFAVSDRSLCKEDEGKRQNFIENVCVSSENNKTFQDSVKGLVEALCRWSAYKSNHGMKKVIEAFRERYTFFDRTVSNIKNSLSKEHLQ